MSAGLTHTSLDSFPHTQMGSNIQTVPHTRKVEAAFGFTKGSLAVCAHRIIFAMPLIFMCEQNDVLLRVQYRCVRVI